MSRPLLLTLIIPLSSCLTLDQMTITEIKDYSSLTDKGIFVTEANNVNFDYTPIGSVVSTTRGAIDTFGGYSVNIDILMTLPKNCLIKEPMDLLILILRVLT